MYGDYDLEKDNLMKLVENEFVMNDLGHEKKYQGWRFGRIE